MIVVASILWFTAIQDKKKIKEDTISYLVEKGYDTDKEIKDMYVVNMGKDKVVNAVVVTFEDEPGVNNIYSYDNDTEQIIQINAVSIESNDSLKHIEN